MRKGFFISGIGTEVGKTVVSAILTQALQADYWKPVQAGDLDDTDSDKIRRWVTAEETHIHSEMYHLTQPMSPHAAAERDGITIDLEQFKLPETNNFMLVEGAGGLLVPLNQHHCMIDLIAQLDLPVVLVSRHYLGSINHTLLSLEALRQRKIPLAALIFNGPENPETEQIIEQIGKPERVIRIGELSELSAEEIARESIALRENMDIHFFLK